MTDFNKINNLLSSLSSSDRWSPKCPKAPEKPRTPKAFFSKWEKLSGEVYGSSERRLDELVDESLRKAGIDPESLPANVREALERTLITAEQDDGNLYLKSEWEELIPNPALESDRASYERGMVHYEMEIALYESKLEAYVAEVTEAKRIVQEHNDLAELKRLQELYGSRRMFRFLSED